MDKDANANGGMLVIATSVPDEREWIQWRGPTARQDRPGQFVVVLDRRAPPFSDHSGLAGEISALPNGDDKLALPLHQLIKMRRAQQKKNNNVKNQKTTTNPHQIAFGGRRAVPERFRDDRRSEVELDVPPVVAAHDVAQEWLAAIAVARRAGSQQLRVHVLTQRSGRATVEHGIHRGHAVGTKGRCRRLGCH